MYGGVSLNARNQVSPQTVIPTPADIPINSAWCGIHRTGGFLAFKTQVINPGAAGAQLYNLFTFSGLVDLKGIYLEFTDVTNVVTVTNCFWEIWDGAANTALTNTQNCSAVTVESRLIKDQTAANAPTLMNANQARFLEVSGPAQKQFQGALLSAKTGATNYIRFGVTTDINTNCTVCCIAIWACRYPNSLLAAT